MKSLFNLGQEKLEGSLQVIESPAREEEKRCCCGQLLAKRIPHGIEIKCKRCKRVTLIQM